MTEAFTILFVFMGVIVVSAVIFGLWVVLTVLKFLFRGIVGLFVSDAPPLPPTALPCPRRGCQAINPMAARFCRRCGQELGSPQQRARQAALW
jgi:ribosomal protein L40E